MQLEDADVTQLQQTLQWLSERREEDRETIEQLTTAVERLAKADNERAQMVVRLDNEIQRLRQDVGPVPSVVSGVQQARELVEGVSERLETLASSFAQSQQLGSVEAERDRRATADVAQQVSNLQRLLETQHTRLQALGEIVRRSQDEVLPLANRMDEVERSSASQASRLRQIDEQHRRIDNLVAASQQRDETLEREVARLGEWQKLADLRWSRQSNEWQQQLDRFRSDLEEAARPIRKIGQQMEQLDTGQKELAERLSQFERRIEMLAQTAMRLEGAINAGREQVAQLAGAITTHQQRIDEAAAVGWQTNERVSRLTANSENVFQEIGRERLRIDEVLSMIDEVEQRRHRLQEQVDGYQHLLREVQAEAAARVEDLQQHLDNVEQSLQARVLEVERRQLAIRERQLSLLQAELREITDVLAVWQEGADGAGTARRLEADQR